MHHKTKIEEQPSKLRKLNQKEEVEECKLTQKQEVEKLKQETL